MLPDSDKQDAYKCPQCGPIKECILDQIPSTASYVISFASIFLFGLWSFFIIPLIFQSTKIIVKKCFYCNSEIERQKFFSIPSLSDQVLQFKFGSCIIVLSRKYAMTLLTIFILLFVYFEFIRQQQGQITKKDVHKRNTSPWINFLQLCGKYQIIDNGLRAKMNFEKYFHDNIVEWEGYLVETRQNNDPSYPYSDWVYIKMEPTESQEDYPDLVLGIQTHFSEQVRQTIAGKPQGQLIKFSGIFENMGNEFNYHLLNAVELKTLDKQKNLQDVQKFGIEAAKLLAKQTQQEQEQNNSTEKLSEQLPTIEDENPENTVIDIPDVQVQDTRENQSQKSITETQESITQPKGDQ